MHDQEFTQPDPDVTDESSVTGQREHMRDILSSVGDQLDRLRRMQDEHEEQVRRLGENERALAERERFALEAAEELNEAKDTLESDREIWAREKEDYQRLYDENLSELQDRERAIAESHVSMETDRRAFEEERTIWSEVREQQEATLAEERRDVEARAAAGVAADQLERELATLREVADEQAARDEHLARELEDITQRSASTQRELDEKTAALERSSGTLNSIETRCRELEAELNATREEREELAARAERLEETARPGNENAIKALEEQLADTQTQLTSAEAARQEMESAHARAQAAFVERDAELHRIQAIHSEGGQAGAMADLRAKAEQIAEVATHLKRRQQRLGAVRAAVKRRGPVAAPASGPVTLDEHAANIRQLEKHRHELAERRSELVVKERRMLRRWAGQRASATVAWFVVIALIAAGASWLTASHFMPATISASITLEAKGRQRGPIPPEVAERRALWHTDLLKEKNFQQSLAKRFEERKMFDLASPGAVASRLDEELAVDAGTPSRLTLTLAGTDRGETRRVLDVIATTVAARSGNDLRKKSEAAWAVVQGERQEKGRLVYATLDPKPIEDKRLIAAAVVFVPLLMALTGFMMFLYRRLARTKREFDEDGSLFEDVPVGETLAATSPFSKVA